MWCWSQSHRIKQTQQLKQRQEIINSYECGADSYNNMCIASPDFFSIIIEPESQQILQQLKIMLLAEVLKCALH